MRGRPQRARRDGQGRVGKRLASLRKAYRENEVAFGKGLRSMMAGEDTEEAVAASETVAEVIMIARAFMVK